MPAHGYSPQPLFLQPYLSHPGDWGLKWREFLPENADKWSQAEYPPRQHNLVPDK